MNKSCEICHSLKDTSYQVLRTSYWNVSLGQNHAYPGRAYVTLLDHKGSLSQLSQDEWDDFRHLVCKLENAYRKAFGAEPLNWSCLMNNAYNEKPFNPHVHWHLIPRYEAAVEVAGVTLKDQEFGQMFTPKKQLIVEDTVIKALIERIKEHL